MWRSDAQMALLADNSKPALQHTLLYGLFYSKRKYHFVKENNGNEKDSKLAFKTIDIVLTFLLM